MSLIYKIFLTVLVVNGTKATLDLEPDLEWDPCNIDLYERNTKLKAGEYRFTPPACKLLNKTKSDICEYFSCVSTLPISKEVIGFVRIKTTWAAGKRPPNVTCLKYPRLPEYVQVIDFSSDFRENITASTFEDVSDLQFIRSMLFISKLIVSISDDVVGNLSNLECVNLDLYSEPYGGHVLRKFMSIPTLKRLSVRHNLLTDKFVVSLPQNSNLRSLWLYDNDFSAANLNSNFSKSLSELPHLKGLDLSKGKLREGIYFRSKTLESLDLSSNSLTKIPLLCNGINKKVYVLQELLRLDISNNQVSDLSRLNHLCVSKLSYLDLRRNLIATFPAILLSEYYPSLTLAHLEYQSVDDVKLSILGLPGPGPFTKHNSPVRELHLENCNQLRFEGELSGDNGWQFFQQTPDLQQLFLDGSNLQLIEEQTFLQVFGHLHDLRTLSLSNTKLQFVSTETIAVFPKLTVLILGDNAITRIPDGCFDSLTQLVYLDLSGNKITTVSSLTFSSSLHGRLQAFDLSQNPLTCSCDLMWFRNWFMSDHKLFKSSAHEYKCHNFPRKILLSDFIVNEQSCLLSREANSMIIFCCSVLITTFTIFILLFRYRWHLRLVLYEAFRGRDDVRRRRLEQGNFDHDVFVSYASEDLNWVRRHLMPQLEDHLHLRLCIHDRQFIPGKNIVDNIADCVEKSKKILMVFTKNFLRSQWCQFELAFCLSHVMEHEDALIILCVDDVVSCEMTSTMMAVLRTTTYIQWENQADAVRSFWGRLKLALNEVIPDDEHAV